nr:aminopeptidase [Paenibacillus selenitireducens]
MYYKEAGEDQLNEVEHLKMLYQYVDAMIRIKSEEHLSELTSIDSTKIQKRLVAYSVSFGYLRAQGKRWVLVQYPTPAYATEAGLSLEEYENFVFGAMNIDYSTLRQDMKTNV